MSYIKPKKKSTALLPVAGFLLIVALGVISYFVSDPVRDLVDRQSGADLSGNEIQWVFTGVIFFVLVLVSGLIYAVAIPKKKDAIRDKDVVNDRKAIEAERLAKKARRRKLKGQMKDM